MIDTIHLYASPDHYSVKRGAEINVVPPTYNLGTGNTIDQKLMYLDEYGRAGTKAYINEEYFNIDINKNGLFLKVTPMRIFNGHNFNSCTKASQIKDTIAYLDAKLKEHKIQVSLKHMSVSQLHLCKTIKTDRVYSDYDPLFKSLSAKVVQKRGYAKAYMFGNNSRKVVFYNKKAEMQAKGLPVPPGEWMRGEIRFLKRAVTERDTGIRFLSDLLDESVFESLNTSYNTVMDKLVFRNKDHDQFYQFYDKETQFLNTLQKIFNRGAISKYLQMYGTDKVLNKFGSLNNFKAFLEACGTTSPTVSRNIDEIKNLIAFKSQFKGVSDVSDLYRELYSKFVSPSILPEKS